MAEPITTAIKIPFAFVWTSSVATVVVYLSIDKVLAKTAAKKIMSNRFYSV